MRATAVLLFLALAVPAAAQDAQTRYISDETAITLRQDKGLDAPVAALLVSGTKVELVEADTSSGYAKVRVGPGREGWVLARYLKTEPVARERLPKIEAALAEQKALVARLEGENAELRGNPPPAAADPARSGMPAGARAIPEASDRSQAQAMFTGAGLFLVGLLIGLLIPYLPRGQRRNWSQL